MNALKWISLAMFVPVLCSGTVQAQNNECLCGIGIAINDFFLDGDAPAENAHVGDEIYYRISVFSSPINCPVEHAEPSVTLPNGTVIDLDDDLSLPPGGSIVYNTKDYLNGVYTVAAADVEGGLIVADAEVVGVCIPPGPTPPEAISSASAVVLSPAITIDKTVDCDDDGEFLDEDTGYAGDTGHWRIVVTNTGDTLLTNVVTTDTNGQSFGPTVLAPGESVQYDYDTIVNVDTTNVATVVAEDETGFVVTATDDATNVVITPDIAIDKKVDCNNDGEFLDTDTGYAGDTGHWRIVVTNTGDSTLSNVITTDTNGQSFGPTVLAPGASVQYDYDTIVNVNTTNVATVVAEDELGGTVTATDDATNLVLNPDITIDKKVDCNNDGVFLDTDTGYAGDTGHWRIVVTNIGDTLLINVMTTDTNGQSFGPTVLAPGESVQYDYDTIVNVDTTNVATVVAEDEIGTIVTATDDATNLVITPAITIDKKVDCNNDGEFLDEDTGTAGDTGHWRIVVTNTGDSTLTNVMTTDTNGQSFGPTTLAPGESVQYDYDTIVNQTTTNTATVVAEDEFGGTVTATDSATNVVTGGDEGCTPGFWKNNGDKHGASAWCDLFSPDMPFSTVFELDEPLTIFNGGNPKKSSSYITNPTLLQALGASGGGVNAMVRHGVAAMLNACSDCVNYPNNDPFQIIMMIEDTLNGAPGAFTVDELHYMFADWNEAGCPVNQHGECVGVEDEI